MLYYIAFVYININRNLFSNPGKTTLLRIRREIFLSEIDDKMMISCAAASHNSEGIAGIAPYCKVMPVRIFNSNGSAISASGLVDAINFAKNNGAHVISNSWGYDSDNPNYIPAIKDAIADATTNGRGGKGSVVVFSAGNTAVHSSGNNGFVCFPSNVEVEGVLTVGASDRYDQQADYSPTSNTDSSYN